MMYGTAGMPTMKPGTVYRPVLGEAVRYASTCWSFRRVLRLVQDPNHIFGSAERSSSGYRFLSQIMNRAIKRRGTGLLRPGSPQRSN